MWSISPLPIQSSTIYYVFSKSDYISIKKAIHAYIHKKVKTNFHTRKKKVITFLYIIYICKLNPNQLDQKLFITENVIRFSIQYLLYTRLYYLARPSLQSIHWKIFSLDLFIHLQLFIHIYRKKFSFSMSKTFSNKFYFTTNSRVQENNSYGINNLLSKQILTLT